MFTRIVVSILAGGLSIASLQAGPYGDNDLETFSRYEQLETGHAWAQFLEESPELEVTSNCKMDSGIYSLASHCIKRNYATRKGLRSQIKFLQKKKSFKRVATKGVGVVNHQLLDSAEALLRWLDTGENLGEKFNVVPLKGYADQSVHVTGYYSPILSARRKADVEYRFPVYRVPFDNRRLLSREAINRGALEGSGLEIAWVKDPIGLFYVHLQGSGVLKFPDESDKTLHYTAANGKRFKSIAQYMKRQGYLQGDLSRRAITHWLNDHPEYLGDVLSANPRYVFFEESTKNFSTASGMGLIPGHTVAVDTKYIPFGAVLLAEVPEVNADGSIVEHKWRLLFPQDRGDAIKGSARLDLYTGKGVKALRVANKVTGARRVYLLLSKKDIGLQTAAK